MIIFLGFLDRDVSNLTVHAVVQAVVNMKEDEQQEFLALEIDVVEKCARRTSYHVPRWFLQGLMDYSTTVRTEFLKDGEGTPYERLLTDTDDRPLITEVFFVNSNGRANFRPSHVVDQFMESVSFTYLKMFNSEKYIQL